MLEKIFILLAFLLLLAFDYFLVYLIYAMFGWAFSIWGVVILFIVQLLLLLTLRNGSHYDDFM
jgi:hypothetical protein